jgi:hypothetical protein
MLLFLNSNKLVNLGNVNSSNSFGIAVIKSFPSYFTNLLGPSSKSNDYNNWFSKLKIFRVFPKVSSINILLS